MTSFLTGYTRQEIFALASYVKRLPLRPVLQYYNVSTNVLKSEVDEAGSLPTLPVQSLDEMLSKYIKSVKPLVSPEEFEKTKALVMKFKDDSGKKLQKLLEERAQNTKNWLTDYWISTAYLEYRNPLPVFSSPGLVWPKFFKQDLKSQLESTSYIIFHALQFNSLVEKNEIPQEYLQGAPLCMNQYSQIFGTCRIPKISKDEILYQDPNNLSSNVIVLYNNHLFSIEVLKKNSREPVDTSEIFTMLSKIVDQGKKAAVPIGILTTEHRDNWARAYEELKKNPKNKDLLEKYVEKALFVVCIDQPLKVGTGLNYDTKCSKLLLHGFGSKGNAGNRWYDKTLQFVVGALDDGSGIIYEHTPAEGGLISMITDYIHSNLKGGFKSLEQSVLENCPKPIRLDFEVNSAIEGAIVSAGDALDKIVNNLEVNSWCFFHFGKEQIKALKVSPDSFIQVAMQYAFYKIHKKPTAHYESGSLRKFSLGRTDVIRTCSPEVLLFCELMSSSSDSDSQAKALLQALDSHKSYVQDVINGKGVDRHLLAFKILAKQNKMRLPEIFDDVAYKRSTHFRISSSSVPVTCNGFMVYGPLTDDGYSCCYNPKNKIIMFSTSAWSSSNITRLNEFKIELDSALGKMKNLILNNRIPSKL